MNHHKIRKLSVTGGFLDGVEIHFKDGLNCLIGGRGTGKTTAQELIRFALSKGRLGDGRATSASGGELVRSNLEFLGQVEIAYESSGGAEFRVRRTYGEDPIVLDDSGEAVDNSLLEAGLLIDAAIFGQNQIEEIAGTPALQRKLLDQYCGKDLVHVEHQIMRARANLKKNAQELIALEQREQELRSKLQDLPSLQAQLSALNEEIAREYVEPEVERLSESKQLRDREREMVHGLAPMVERLNQDLEVWKRSVSHGLRFEIPAEILEGPRGNTFAELAKHVEDIRAQLSAGVQAAAEALGAIQTEIEGTRNGLLREWVAEDAKYQETLTAAKSQTVKIARRDKLAKEVMQLQAVDAEVACSLEERGRILATRSELLAEFSAALDRRFELRNEIAGRLNQRLEGTVQVLVDRHADVSAYADFLAEQMKNSGKKYRDGVQRVAASIPPEHLARFTTSDQFTIIAKKADINDDLAKALAGALRRRRDTVFELESMPVDDKITIELNVGGHLRPASRLSTGQRCSAILPILLHEDVAPLLIDQPEDNLDNSYIFDTVVPQLATTVARRQMIFITHNPNIPVLGDASHVVVLESDGRRAWVRDQGSVDAMKVHIQDLLEGGEEAFERRRTRYGR